MSLYRLEFLKSGSVNIANGSDTITVTGSVDCSSVYSGTAIFIDNYQVVEAVSGTGFNPSTGESTIKLRSAWNNPTVTSGVLVGFNTFEGLNSAVSRLNEIVKQYDVIGDATESEKGVVLLATTAEAEDATNNTKAMTPKKVFDSYSKYGLGEDFPSNLSNMNTVTKGGFYSYSFGATGGVSAYGGSAITIPRAGAGYSSQIAISADGEAGFRFYDNSVWGDYIKLYTDSTLNINKFGYSSNGLIGKGEAIDATKIVVDIQLHSYNKPTSISKSGTFSVITVGGAVVRSGIPSSDLVMLAESSGNLIRIQVNNNTGLTSGNRYILRSENASSGFEVTY